MTVAISPASATQASDLRVSNEFLPENNRPFDLSTPADPAKPSAFVDSFIGALWHENTVMSTLKALTDDHPETDYTKVTAYNPFLALKAQFPAETLDKLKTPISDGVFDEVRSDAQLQAVVQDQLDRQKMTDGAGYLAGSLFAAVLDPTSYIPFLGEGANVARFGKIGLGALNAALSAGASEAILSATQRDRPMSETLMNIGTAGFIGGGLGIFASSMHPKSAMHPDNPNNIFRPENLRQDGEISRDMTGKADELSAEEIKSLSDNYVAAGAAPIRDANPAIARVQPTSGLGKAVAAVTTRVDKVLNSVTLKGQILRSTSGPARWIGVRLFDPAGILMEHNLKGIGNAPSATILKQHYMSEFEQFSAKMQGATRQLAGDVKARVDFKDMMVLTQKHLYSTMDDATVSRFVQKYGADFQKVDQLAQQFAEGAHKYNAMWEERLTKAGLMQDTNLVTQLAGEVKAAREAVKLHRAANGDEATLKTLINDREAKVATLRQEKLKPTPLGRDYGHAQMWNRDAVFQSPSDFKAWLHDVFAFTPDEDWLLSQHHMTAEEFSKLTPEEARPIREDWSGDSYGWRVDNLEHAHKAAKERLKEAKLDLMETMRSLGVARKDEVDITVQEARARRDAIHTQIAANKAHQITLEKEIRAFKEAATAARMAGNDRLHAHGPTDAELNRDQKVASATKAQDKANTSALDALTDPATPKDAAGNPRFLDAGDVVQNLDKQANANNAMFNAEAATRQNGDNISVATARQEGKAKEAQLGIERLAKESEALDAKLAAIDEKLHQVESLHDGVTNARRELKDASVEAKKVRAENEKSARALGRELSAARKATPLNEMIDQVYSTLSDRGTTPQGIMDRLLQESDRTTGRVQKRGLTLSREQRAEAIQRGWLRDDLSNILYAQTDQLASELSLREALGIGKGKQFVTWGDALGWVERDYQDRIEAAGSQKEKAALTAEMKKTMDNLVMTRDRLKGGVHVDDGTSSGWLGWGASKMKQANMIRYGSGFTLSSLTDTSTVALRHGNLATLLMRHGVRAVKIMRAAADEDMTAFKAFIASTEIGMGAHASARRFGTEDALNGHMYGYGFGHGNVRKVTAAIDKKAELLSEIGVKLGGLPLWNTFWKTVAGLDMLDRLHSMTARYGIDPEAKGALKASEIADLATLGIGKEEALRIADFMKAHGVRDADGHFDPHFEKWEGDAGLSAKRDAELAIMRDMNRSINTPDVADTPRLMSTLHGSMLLSFQTFAFTFMNQYAYPLVQRLGLFHEKQAAMSLGILMGSAAMVLIGKDIINGRDPSQRFTAENWPKTTYDIVDRSGLLGWTSPYDDFVLKSTGIGGGSRYARNDAWQSLLGINAGLAGDLTHAVVAVTNGDPNAARKVLAVAPFNTQLRLFNRILEHNP